MAAPVSSLNSRRPSVTVHEVLRLALPPGSVVAGGRAGLQRLVSSALLLRPRVGAATSGRAAVLDVGESGGFVILPGGAASLTGGEAGLERLVRGLAEAGASSFAMVQTPPDSVVRAADSLERTLVVLPSGSLPEEVERSVIGLLQNRDERIHRRVEEVHERLLATLVEEDGARLLAAELRTATGKSTYVLDSFLQVLAGASFEPETDVPRLRQRLAEALTAQMATARPSTASSLSAGPGRAEAAGTHPLRLYLDRQGVGQSVLARAVELRGARAGFLCLLGEAGEFAELDERLTERAASVLAIELAKQRAVAEARLRQQGDFLDDLLDGAFPSPEAALARARSLGYDLSRPYLVFVLEPALPQDPRSASEEHARFVEAVRTELLRPASPALVGERDGRVTVARPTGAGPENNDHAEVEALRARISANLGGVAIAAGISRRVEEPGQFRSAQREATMALEVARLMFGGERSVRFEELGVQRLLLQLVGNPELEAYRHDLIGRLEEYDARHRSELTRTLEVFLACHGNHVRAARELHLHRNTLLYRLERARAILGHNLDDADTRLAVQLALKLRHLPATARLESTASKLHNLPPAGQR